MKKLLFLVFSLLFLSVGYCSEGLLPDKPSKGYVVDLTGTFTPQATQKINSAINQLKEEKKVVFSVLMISSLDGQDIAEYAHRVAEHWAPGIDGIGKGAVILIAKNDHKVRVEQSKNLEGELPDSLIQDILEDNMQHFKAGDFARGILGIINNLGSKVEAPVPVVGEEEGMSPIALGLIIVGVISALGGITGALLALKGTGGISGALARKKVEEEIEEEVDKVAIDKAVAEAKQQLRSHNNLEAAGAAALSVAAIDGNSLPRSSSKYHPKRVAVDQVQEKPSVVDDYYRRKYDQKPEEAKRPSSRSNSDNILNTVVAAEILSTVAEVAISRRDDDDDDDRRSNSYSPSDDSSSSSFSMPDFSSSSSSDFGGGGSSSSWD